MKFFVVFFFVFFFVCFLARKTSTQRLQWLSLFLSCGLVSILQPHTAPHQGAKKRERGRDEGERAVNNQQKEEEEENNLEKPTHHRTRR